MIRVNHKSYDALNRPDITVFYGLQEAVSWKTHPDVGMKFLIRNKKLMENHYFLLIILRHF